MSVVAAILLPAVGALLWISATARPDLFDLVPVDSHSDGYVLLAWPALERGRQALNAGEIGPGTPIRALGYMMEDHQPIREGEPIEDFVLSPDVGNAWHPAHRFGDEMIRVQLDGGKAVRFFERQLVWVWGTLRLLPGDPAGHEPLYVLEHARSEPASQDEVRRFFR